ncbi:hypothetical protein SAMN05720470_101202 [Fibrobacter sp. UWOV1]|uniref:hypothetical protein n=1 Tax=Fibrobacter sp. UWOV1 TaxID=1896215 RepID=UPI00092320E2|nr:hypothetical protein [Fibrobacter sp. UWOV1]SHK35834.1 hypothetical protein SAMN05720470_101202 [Fibrobacter sp. UWOV1]
MKKLNICIAGALALLCTSCSDSDGVKDLTGTSEELNEVADKGSSSSGTPGVESSSSIGDQNQNSSSSGDVHTPPSNNGSLEAYLQQYGLETKHRFDKAVLAFNKSEMVSRTPAMDGSTNSTEFDGEGVSKFVQQNIGAIEALFPKAAAKYADLVEATKNGTNECSLYSFNLYGNEKYAGHVLEYVSPDTMKVVDIEAKNCEENTSNQIVRFLFSYCGDVSEEPVVERTTAKSDIAKENCPASKTDDEWVNVIDSKDIVTSSSSETPSSSAAENPASSSSKEIETCQHISDYDGMTANGNCDSNKDTSIVIDCVTGEEMKCVDNYWTRAKACAPGSDCDGDGIPDGVRRIDLEPCDTDTLLYFYGRSYQCIENKWVYLPPPGPDSTYSQARNVSVLPRQGMAVTPRVVIVKNADGTVSIRDDGYYATNNFVIKDVYTELSGDTIIVDVIYPDGANLHSYQISALTFTVSKEYTNVKYLRYKDDDRVKPLFEEDELLPCASSSTCQECGEGLDC